MAGTTSNVMKSGAKVWVAPSGTAYPETSVAAGAS